MRKVLFSAIFFIIFFTSHLFIYANGSFTLKSKDLGGQGTLEQVFNGFGCTGENISPELNWQNIPEGTKSFAITMIDLNAFGPNIPFDHWMLINLPSSFLFLRNSSLSSLIISPRFGAGIRRQASKPLSAIFTTPS